MLGAFKDIFGKKAADLNKKEFHDSEKVYTYKLTSKTADGVSFEGNLSNGTKDDKDNLASDLNLNFKDDLMEVKNKLDNKAVFTVETTMFAIADGVDAGLKLVTPKASDSGNKALFENVTGSTTYKAKDISAKGELQLAFGSDSAFTPTGHKITAEVCAKVMDDITAGLSVQDLCIGTADSTVSVKCVDLGGIYTSGDLQVAGHLKGTVDKNQPTADGLTASVWNQATKETALSGEFSLGKDNAVKIALGTAFKMTDLSTFKTKLTYASAAKPQLDFAWIHKFEGKSLTLNHKYNEKDGSKFGLGLTIDA